MHFCNFFCKIFKTEKVLVSRLSPRLKNNKVWASGKRILLKFLKALLRFLRVDFSFLITHFTFGGLLSDFCAHFYYLFKNNDTLFKIQKRIHFHYVFFNIKGNMGTIFLTDIKSANFKWGVEKV